VIDIPLAANRIRPYIRLTPILDSEGVALKLENLQHTGAFKVRGAFNKLLSLAPDALARGVVTASTGNHGQAVAYAARALGTAARVFVPSTASAAKLDKIRALGAPLEVAGDDGVVSELAAIAYAREHGLAYVSPYNDPDVIAGQGTLGLELLAQVADLANVYVAVGGGGLIAGVASALKAARPSLRVIGCWPEASPVMLASMRAGQIVDLPNLPTLSDATAGGIEPGAITLDLCRALIDEPVVVSEAEILSALRSLYARERLIVEGAAGVALAAYARHPLPNAAIVVCGGNVSREVVEAIVR
jgi:threonine dehydratase